MSEQMERITVKQDGSLEVQTKRGETIRLPQYSYTMVVTNWGGVAGVEVRATFKEHGIPRYIELSSRDGLSFS